MKFTENGERRAFLVELGDSRVSVESIAVNRYLYEEAEIDCTMLESAQEINKIISRPAGEEKLIKVKLVGTPALDFDFDLDGEATRQDFFFLDII